MNRSFAFQSGLAFWVLIAAAVAGGCMKSEPSQTAAPPVVTNLVKDEKTSTESKPAAEPVDPDGNAKAATGSDIPLKVASWEQTKEIVASHKGKVVVLDLWSSYCPPCLEELPNLVKLHKQHGGEVVCLSLNCNFSGTGSPEADREAILKILREKKAIFQNFISSDPDETLYKKVGIASIPVVQVYDRSGKLSKQFDNEKNEYGDDGFTYAKHIVPYVEKLIKQAE